MPSTIADEMRAIADRATQLIESIQAEDRDMSPQERHQLDVWENELSALKARQESRQATQRLLERFNNGRPGGPGPRVGLGGQIVAHTEFQQYRAALGGGMAVRAVPLEVPLSTVPDVRAATPLLPPAGGWPAMTQGPAPPAAGAPWGLRRLASLFTERAWDTGGAVPYLRTSSFTTTAAPVPPGALKPEGALAPTLLSEELVVLAWWCTVSNSTLTDVDGFANWINSYLLLGLVVAEDSYLVTKLLGTPGLAPPHAKTTTESVADAVLAQAMAIQTATKMPVDAVAMSPDSFQAYLTAKATTSGLYLSGQPLSSPPSAGVWGLPVVVSSAIASGTAIVGAFGAGATLFRKGSVRVDLGQVNDDFIRNLTTIRAEVRELLAVFVPPSFGTVTGLAA
jgi:hypothetical protein